MKAKQDTFVCEVCGGKEEIPADELPKEDWTLLAGTRGKVIHTRCTERYLAGEKQV